MGLSEAARYGRLKSHSFRDTQPNPAFIQYALVIIPRNIDDKSSPSGVNYKLHNSNQWFFHIALIDDAFEAICDLISHLTRFNSEGFQYPNHRLNSYALSDLHLMARVPY